MSALDLFKPRHPAPPADYVTGGASPSAAFGHELAESERHAEAVNLAAQAHTGPQTVAPTTDPPLVRHVKVGNEEWWVETVAVPAGTVVEIIGREGTRVTFDIANVSSMLNGGTGVLCALTRNRGDAERLANGQLAFLSPGKHCYLDDGADRTMTHTAPVFVVTDPAAAAVAYIDLSMETDRHHVPYGHHHAHR